MKSEVFVAKEEIYDKWKGEYTVKVLSGAESLTIEEVIFKRLEKKGGRVTIKNYPIMLERKLSLAKAVTRDNKPITTKDIEAMPRRLYTILFGLYQRLNVPSQEEADFLLKV